MLKMNMFRTMRLLGGLQIRLQNTGAPASIPAVEEAVKPRPRNQRSSGLVAAAFASLNDESQPASAAVPSGNVQGKIAEKIASMGKLIDAAEDVPSLLSIAEKQLSREDSLKIISKLSDWSSSDKIQISEFESDARFINLCHYLGNSVSKNSRREYYVSKSEDLSTVLGVTGDERAARLVANLNLSQMVKVMSNLALKRRRSTPLLRALSYNINQKTETIDIKKCADILYSMALLNFPDPPLMERLCNDIQINIDNNKDKSSVVGSIATSLGVLKYKDPKLMDSLYEWLITHKNICRAQDIAAYVITAANLGYFSEGIQNLPILLQSDFAKSSSYLDYIWSMLVLNNVTKEQVISVLSPTFVESLKIDKEVPFQCLKRLCNINAYASMMLKNYEGPLLSDKLFESIQITYSKEKLQYVNVLLDTLKSLLSSEANIDKNCDSKMGFLFDAYMMLDKKCTPYPVKSEEKLRGKSLTKIAFFGLDYHDLCKNTREPLGNILLYKRLLEEKGYKVVLVPYTEFSISEKLMYRVQYIDNRIKEIVSQ